ncbi:hypothetical protein ACNJ7E_26740 [Rhodococcus sp. NM-2]|uniref:hypothetical protein n=1 Tax=Rhodococcus sp. NM-2 TaxID=3401174 RepID=UPI003AAC98FC
MKIFIDECVNKKMVAALSLICPRHQFLVGGKDTAPAVKDIPLFGEVAGLGAELFVTTDARQLMDPTRGAERTECREQGLSWLGIPRVAAKGRLSLYGEMSNLVAGLELIVREIEASAFPQFYLLKRGHTKLELVVQDQGKV